VLERLIQRLAFSLWYLFKPPWDRGITPPELIELVEGGELPPGRAIDLGCGSGTNVLYLASHGFDVVGVDFAPVAITKARRKAARAGVQARFYTGDVLAVGSPGGVPVEAPFDLALDIGCFHGFDAVGRRRYADMLARITRPGSLFLLYAFGPPDARAEGSRAPFGPNGLSVAEVEQTFAETFKLRWVRAGSFRMRPSAWYLFEHREGTRCLNRS